MYGEKYVKLYGIRLESLYEKGKYRNLVLNHILEKRLPSSQWRADLLVDSKLPGHKLRINKYSNGIETVNCEDVIRKNQHATNGVVHVIDGVLNPNLFKNEDLMEIIEEDGRFSVLAESLQKSDLIKRIRNSEIPHTIFAPSDEAFQKIPRTRLNKILDDKETLEALLANHIVAHPVCLPGVISEHRVKSLGPHKLTLNCTSRGPTIERRRLHQDLLHGKNGLVYMVDDVLFPDRAKTVLELLQDEKLYLFSQLIQKADLNEVLSNLESYTLFAPSEAAMYSIPEREFEELVSNQDSARRFVLNHAVLGRYTTDAVSANQIVTSLDETTPLRFEVYRGSVGIEDALIEKADREGSDGVLHIISKVLYPTTNSLDDALRQNGNFSIWLRAMDKMREVEPSTFEELKRPQSSYTYFVPSDEAFRKLGEARLQKIMGDGKYLTKVNKDYYIRTIQNHVSENMMASEGFKPDLHYAVRTKQTTVDLVKKNDKIKVNDATLTKCDIMNINGVAHGITKVLLPDQHYHYVKRKRGARKARRIPL
ncbi:transforming growth factor-beta-induced protein ig-h3 [Cephus cinctus]|uniref:Transforming growth factor-beta-induced protein ig-h3 n=1 Tax=Cephus cinctus TaxID=211228 RepID=A0AAJ7W7T1_CEPCN|nr:transforming growth factor-beta-induced protein ig-h3 [Cephus cinctus]